eukprot:Lithocolla_globosa_v1_NODE_7950_length_883_cov_4.306763.p2 type:complete len:116 gc:universal NODE_7950_length_883_cov_4.306763:786-439(-)
MRHHRQLIYNHHNIENILNLIQKYRLKEPYSLKYMGMYNTRPCNKSHNHKKNDTSYKHQMYSHNKCSFAGHNTAKGNNNYSHRHSFHRYNRVDEVPPCCRFQRNCPSHHRRERGL